MTGQEILLFPVIKSIKLAAKSKFYILHRHLIMATWMRSLIDALLNRTALKHLDRRKRVQEKQNSFLTKDIKEKSGILAMTILYFWDSIIELIFRVFFATVDIGKYSYNYIKIFLGIAY